MTDFKWSNVLISKVGRIALSLTCCEWASAT